MDVKFQEYVMFFKNGVKLRMVKLSNSKIILTVRVIQVWKNVLRKAMKIVSFIMTGQGVRKYFAVSNHAF